MNECQCKKQHPQRRIVITGAPGSGKTAVLEMLRRYVCEHSRILPEAASIVFRGGFPSDNDPSWRRAAQRLVYHVQRELEGAAEHENLALVLCEHGTVDSLAYWLGQDDFLTHVGTTLDAELHRYDVVIHLRTPPLDRDNPMQSEARPEAAAIDERIFAAWQRHPRRFVIEGVADFLTKATQVVQIVRGETPLCCQPGFKVTSSIPVFPSA